ncbi:hypothetical protein IAS59_003752 [Cryptococcus gattii]
MNPGTAPSIYSLQEKNVKSSRAIIANNALPDKEMVLAPKRPHLKSLGKDHSQSPLQKRSKSPLTLSDEGYVCRRRRAIIRSS